MQELKNITEVQWIDLAHELGKQFAEREEKYDQEGAFVKENYLQLKEHRFFAATIPTELGGHGVSHSQMCEIIRVIGHYSGSTALSLAMHQHLLAANIWKYKQGLGSEEMLKKVAENQPVLVSTGARDWLESNGLMEKVEGGYKVTAQKHFASQSEVGDILVTSSAYNDPDLGWQVLHFPVPFTTEGLTVLDNWDTLGMRGTGSHTVKLDNVFVPDSAIVLRRPQGEFHPFWSAVLTVAMPLIMSTYVGIAEKAAQIAVDNARGNKSRKPHLPYLIAEMNNELTAAQVQWKDMIRICNDLNFKPLDENAHAILTRKTNVAKAAIKTVKKAVEIAGGFGYFKNSELEQLFRDVQAVQYHPLQEKDQQLFSGEYLLKK